MRMLTSAVANKMIRTLQEEKKYILDMEAEGKEYISSDNEQPIIPEYDYKKTSEKINEIDLKVMKLKHSINVFNTNTILEKLGMTIDEALVRMSQLNFRKTMLDDMRKKLPKTRIDNSKNFGRVSSLVEYLHLNYDLDKVQDDYQKISDEIINIQLELDLCNQTKLFEVDID